MGEKLTAEDIDCSLPAHICTSSSSKAQMLYIAEALRCLTDEEHGLTAQQLADAIAVRTGKAPSEPKVLRDLRLLSENTPFGMQVEAPTRGKNTGFKCTKLFVTSSQARLLINMVHTCKFITPAQRRELVEALHSMVSYYQQDAIVEDVHTDSRERPATPDVFLAADKAAEAIKKGRCLEFRYADRTFGEEFLLSGEEGPILFVETPIALIYSFGNYYLETWSTYECDGRRLVRRLDKIRDPVVSDVLAVKSSEIDSLRETVEERTAQVFDMWGDGTPRTLFLRVEARMAKYVYDRFGSDVKFEHVSADRSVGFTCVVVQLSPTFFRWLFGMGDGIKVIKPVDALWVDAFWKETPRAKKEHGYLIEDYAIAMQQYLDLLETARTLEG
ncbi:MAG: WYL domain-containing protein [Eggerthellaceae bacterium]|nr:WYL domain-containing protein [Eggerthellaceae bacterium]